MKAWHFTNGSLRDGRPVPPPGETLRHDGKLVLCKSGLHASVRILDALKHAPGHMIHRVKVGGEIIRDDDTLVASERTILWTVDGEQLLLRFARRCALDVIHLWDAPDVVVRYLRTGDESLRAAARGATWAARAARAARAAWEAAWEAAWAAAWADAREAAQAVREATWAARAARDAADAAWDKQNRRLTRMVYRERRCG